MTSRSDQRKKRELKHYRPEPDAPIGFWDRPADERAQIMGAAAERCGVEHFFDLSPEERFQAYDGRTE